MTKWVALRTFWFGTLLISACLVLWVAAVWTGGETGGKLGATGGILIVPSVVTTLISAGLRWWNE